VKPLKNYVDSKGFIGHGLPNPLEFGDGAQRLGTIWIKRFVQYSDPQSESLRESLAKDFLVQLELIHLNSGEWVRHWDHSKWPGQSGIMSRDQMDPLLMAMILWSPYDPRIEELAKETVITIIKRFGFLWNFKHIWPKPEDKSKLIPDWYGVSILGHAIRLWKVYPLYILLPLLDIELEINSLFRVVGGLLNKNDVDGDINHQVRLAFAQLHTPTFIGKIAKYLYKWLRPKPALQDGTVLEGDPIKTTWQVYYYGENNPPIDVEWKLVQDRWL
jgi:hypothetical protein